MIEYVASLAVLLSLYGVTIVGAFRVGQARGRQASELPPAPTAVCSCGHGSGKHPGNGEHCGGTTVVRREWVAADWPYSRHEDEILGCGCTRYDGPDPEMLRLTWGTS